MQHTRLLLPFRISFPHYHAAVPASALPCSRIVQMNTLTCPQEDLTNVMAIIDLSVNGCFLLDVAFNFRTAFPSKHPCGPCVGADQHLFPGCTLVL
jgi:hypothetical protein